MKTKLTPIASAITLLVMSTTMSAQAQTAAQTTTAQPADQTQQVVVTGVRGALAASLTQKRNSESHVDVITAEDIGKMPDKNVADSLQRVAGVTISSAGATEGGFDENDRVSMRGTNPSLTQTLINGHNIGSGDWFVLDQTGTVGRSVSYTLLPSEIVGSVVVHKTSQADLVEGGVAGSVDIITRKPLDFKKDLTIEVSAGAVYAELPKKTDPQFSALMNWKNPEHTFGILVQAFSEDRHLRRDGVEDLGYESIAPGSAIATAHPDLSGVKYPVEIGSAFFEQERKRNGGMFDLQFRPNNDLSFDISGFMSKMNATNYNRNYMVWNTNILGKGAGQAPNPGYTVQGNTLTSATFAPVAGTNYGIYDMISRPNESASTNFLALDGKYKVTSDFTLTTNMGTSTGHGKTPVQDVAEYNTNKGTGASYQLNGANAAPSFGFGNTAAQSNLSSVSGLNWIFGDQNYNVEDKETWLQLDGKYKVGTDTLQSIEVGVRGSDHKRGLTGDYNQRPALDGSAAVPGNSPSTYSNYPSNFGSGLGSGFPNNAWYYTPGQLAAFDSQYAYRPTDGSREDWSNEYSMKERIFATYVQANLQGAGWSGNAGVRLVQTKEHVVNYVNATAQTPGVVTTSLFGDYVAQPTDNTYNDVLPSLNLRFDLRDDLVGRFAVSRTMTRADYSALAGGGNYNAPQNDVGVGGGSLGNANLKPITSNNLDLSLEYYFAPKALLSVSPFYMDLTSITGLGTVNTTHETFDAANPNGIMDNYQLTQPINSKGSVKGVEFAVELPIMTNYGISGSYTYANGEETGGLPLVGNSKNSGNLSGYYEDDKFNARLSYNYRSAFYSGLDRSTAYYQAGTGVVSAALGYKLNEQIAFSLDMLNLNNPTLKYYATSDEPRAIYQSGRQFYLNAHFKY